MRIIHAVCDENGKARGGIAGDQTGKEIREAKWYVREGGWAQYIECTDEAIAGRAVIIAEAIEKGNYGYSQDNRWSGYESICSSTIEGGRGDFDCSSLVLSCYILAGLNIRPSGSTHDLAKRLCDTGKFVCYTGAGHTENCDKARKGSLYCTPGKHVIMCIEDGSQVPVNEISSNDQGVSEVEVPVYAPANQVKALGSVRIRDVPKTGKTIAIAHKGDLLEVFDTDPETGWYKTASGFITNNEKYVEVIKC